MISPLLNKWGNQCTGRISDLPKLIQLGICTPTEYSSIHWTYYLSRYPLSYSSRSLDFRHAENSLASLAWQLFSRCVLSSSQTQGMGSHDTIQHHLWGFFNIHEAEVSSPRETGCRDHANIYILKSHPSDSVTPFRCQVEK